MGEKEFGVAEQMKAVEAHIHKGAGCRCQELFIFFLLLFGFFAIHWIFSFCYPLDFFATLCPIPPWLRTVPCLCSFAELTFITLRTSCVTVRPKSEFGQR